MPMMAPMGMPAGAAKFFGAGAPTAPAGMMAPMPIQGAMPMNR